MGSFVAPSYNQVMPQHIGIVACSAEGAALCYRTICVEGAQLLGPHAHPEVSMHTNSLAEYMECKPEAIACFQRVIGRMKDERCDAVVLGCTEIPLIMNDSNSPLPTLDSTRLLARAALHQAVQGNTRVLSPLR